MGDDPTRGTTSKDTVLMSPITIAIALLACSLLIAFAYVLVDERV